MGRKNKKRPKRSNDLKNLVSLVEYRKLCPSLIQDIKEEFTENLRKIYYYHLSNFYENFNINISLGTGYFGLSEQLPESPLKIQLLTQAYKYDLSIEFNHIFYAQVNNFVDKLVCGIRELEGKPTNEVMAAIGNAYLLSEQAALDANNVAQVIFSQNPNSELNCFSISNLLFYEKLKKEKVVKQALNIVPKQDSFNLTQTASISALVCFFEPDSEGSEEGSKSSNKKRRKRKRKKEQVQETVCPEVDQEVTEFQKRLQEVQPCQKKLKANVSREWVLRLKSELKLQLTSLKT